MQVGSAVAGGPSSRLGGAAHTCRKRREQPGDRAQAKGPAPAAVGAPRDAGVVRRGLRLPGSVGANSDAKVATVLLGMLAGADTIDLAVHPGSGDE